jgi:hypothetical protein
MVFLFLFDDGRRSLASFYLQPRHRRCCFDLSPRSAENTQSTSIEDILGTG